MYIAYVRDIKADGKNIEAIKKKLVFNSFNSS